MRALVLLCLATAVAHADDRADARAEFAAGQAADRARDYQAAIDHYLRANDLVPHPYAMFNIAHDYERLGRRREAAAWYRRYLDAAPDSTDRRTVERKLAALAATPGALTVRTPRDGARVAIDGRWVGRTPYTAVVAAGRHRVTVDDGVHREVHEATVAYGEPALVEVALGASDTPPGAPGAPGAVPGTPPGVGPAPLGTIAPAPKPRRRLGYLVGFGGGADLRGEGAVGLFDLGYAFWTVDFGIRAGKAAGLSTIDVVGRWAVIDAPLSPYVGLGYTVLVDNDPDDDGGPTSARGFTVIAGVKYDVARGERVVTSIVLESGVRGNGDAGPYVVPLIASLQISGFYTSR